MPIRVISQLLQGYFFIQQKISIPISIKKKRLFDIGWFIKMFILVAKLHRERKGIKYQLGAIFTRWNLENRRKDLREKDIRGGGNSITVHVPFNLITLGNLASFQPPVTTALPLTNNIVDDPAGAFWFDLLHYKSVLLGSRQQDRESSMIGRSTEKDERRKDLKRVKETGADGIE